MGLWGSIVNGIQAASLEHRQIRDAPWTGAVVGLLLAYTAGKSIFNVLLQAGQQKDDICHMHSNGDVVYCGTYVVSTGVVSIFQFVFALQ